MKPNRAAIREARERSGFSQAEAAERTNGSVSRPLWANIEAGRKNGSPATLRRIAETLGVPFETIVVFSHQLENEDAA